MIVVNLTNPQIKHGTIKVGFTPDEEIGRGADFFDVEKFGCEWAYTMDGSQIGELEYEAETKVDVSPTTFQQYAELVNYYNTENWTALDITFDEELGRVLTILSNDNTAFSEPLEKPVALPEKGFYIFEILL